MLASFALVACGDDDGGDAGPSGEAVTTTAPDLGGELGCESFEEQPTEELYVRELYACERGGESTNVYTFNDAEARDSWREVAEGFGAVVVTEGDTWLEVEPL